MEEMSVTKALAELKLLDKRINKEISNLDAITTAKKGCKKIDGMQTEEEFIETAKNQYKSILDLIERRKEIKAAIVESNAKTILNVAGIEMTRAEAIERKDSIQYEIDLLNRMKDNYNKTISTYNYKNEEVQEKLNNLLEISLGKEGNRKASKEDIENISAPFLEQNEWKIIDPLNIKGAIEALEKDIDNFLSEVDFVLSESNTITKIKI